MFVAMVAIGSGGAFNGITYRDDLGRLCTGADFILNRLPLAQANQYEICYAMQQQLDYVSPYAKRLQGGNAIMPRW